MEDYPLDRDARIKLSIGTKKYGDADGQFYFPRGLVFDHHRGLLFVADTNHNRVQVFSCDDGSFVSKFGKEGSQPGQFYGPRGIAIDHDHDRIFVVDTCKSRVQSWSLSEQSFLSCVGHRGSGDLEFFNPKGIVIDKHHHRRLRQPSIGVLVVDRSLVLVLHRQARISAWRVLRSIKRCDR